MTAPLSKLLIVTRPDDDSALALKDRMTDWLTVRNAAVEWCEHRIDGCAEERLNGDYDLIVVLGGDGTFIGAARRLHRLGAPLMGVNLGRVGFLAQLDREGWREWLKTALKDGFPVTGRLVLEYQILRRGEAVGRGLVINDLVVGRGELARLVRMNISFDGCHLASLRADGLIVSTPTGASAYNASAGGPLVHPGLPVFCVTPVCPFLASSKSLVLPATGTVTIGVEERGEVNLTEDGQSVVRVKRGDEIVLRRAAKDLRVVDFGSAAYFDKLKKNGFLTEK